MDYKFETKEILDKDTSVEFNAFILADSSSNIRMGYSNYGNKHLLIKTKSYLKYEFGEVYVPQVSIERKKKDFPKAEGKIKIDSVVFYVKCIIPGKYYYHYLNHIPSSLEPVGSGHKYEVKESNKRNPFNKELNNTYPCMILSSEQPDMYLIVTNEKNEIIAILK